MGKTARPGLINADRPLGIGVAAALMVLFGLAEVVTGFTHDFFGITISTARISTYSTAAIGAFYAAAGVLILTMKKWAAAIALVLLVADIVGRVALVVTGLYRTDSVKNTLSISVGTAIVAIFATYIGLKWKSFER